MFVSSANNKKWSKGAARGKSFIKMRKRRGPNGRYSSVTISPTIAN